MRVALPLPSLFERLEQKLQAELHLSRQVGLRADDAEGCVCHAGVGSAELDVVEGVVKLGAELHFDVFDGGELLEER